MTPTPTPAIVLATVRTGAIFLTHCVSSHPDVFGWCTEPFHRKSILRIHLKDDRRKMFDVLFGKWGYQVNLFKVNYRTLTPGDWQHLKELKTRVLHLTRDNTLRIVVSMLINSARGVPSHTTVPVKAAPIVVEPERVLQLCRQLSGEVIEHRELLEAVGLQTLELTYSGIVGGEGRQASEIDEPVAVRICDFLDLEALPLSCRLVRTNPYPLAELVENWGQLRPVIAGSEFAGCLEGE